MKETDVFELCTATKVVDGRNSLSFLSLSLKRRFVFYRKILDASLVFVTVVHETRDIEKEGFR